MSKIKQMNKVKLLAMVALPVIFIVLISGVFSQNVSPYVSVSQVKQGNMTQRNIQVYGQAVMDTINYNRNTNILTFDLTDGNNTVTVQYRGIVNNLQNSTEVVAIGVYKGGVIQAEKILVKCPSKYEAAAKEG
ncbi:MAG: cytochrome c maturation protein CcmE [Thaumarchaeota archaeon]|nr:cytochrome c maturation protein CcmE [Nitrososphaerota archaeon]